MDWVEGANFLGTSDILPLRVAASTFSRPLADSPLSADLFGQNGWFTFPSFLVTKLEQHRSACSSPILLSQQLLRRLVSCDYCCNHTKPSPWSHIELHLVRPKLLSSNLFGVHIVGFELGNCSLASHQHPGHSTVWLQCARWCRVFPYIEMLGSEFCVAFVPSASITGFCVNAVQFSSLRVIMSFRLLIPFLTVACHR